MEESNNESRLCRVNGLNNETYKEFRKMCIDLDQTGSYVIGDLMKKKVGEYYFIRFLEKFVFV